MNKYLLDIVKKSLTLDEKILYLSSNINGLNTKSQTMDLFNLWSSATGNRKKEDFELRLSKFKIPNPLSNFLFDKEFDFQVDKIPQWAQFLEKLIQFVSCTQYSSNNWLNIPFEEILFPISDFALSQSNLQKYGLTDSLIKQLQIQLINLLSYLSARVLYAEYIIFKYFDVKEKGSYLRFIKWLYSNIGEVFRAYPVLGRLVSETLLNWIDNLHHLLNDYKTNRKVLCATFGIGDSDSLKHINLNFSDWHDGNKSVAVLEFQSGKKIVYKPRRLDSLEWFNDFLEYFNQKKRSLDCYVMTFLNLEKSGFVEYIYHKECDNPKCLNKFYEKIGVILCFLYFFEGKDMHFENIIAHDGYPVLIDLEMLVSNKVAHVESKSKDSIYFKAMNIISNSVLGTGLLPDFQISVDKSTYDISGIGIDKIQETSAKEIYWLNIGKDNISFEYRSSIIEKEKNLPSTKIASITSKYGDSILAGFKETYSFLINISENEGSFRLFNTKSIYSRYLHRSTNVYSTLLNISLEPKYLTNSVERQLLFENLALPYIKLDKYWGILEEEIRNIEKLDIPLFSCKNNGLVSNNNRIIVEGYFETRHGDYFFNKSKRLNDNDLKKQLEIIRSSLLYSYQHSSITNSSSPVNSNFYQSISIQKNKNYLVEEAISIGNHIIESCIELKDSVSWIYLQFNPEYGKYIYRSTGISIYNGNSGIAIFLSALFSLTGIKKFREYAIKSLKYLIGIVENSDVNELSSLGCSGLTGLASLQYSLITCSHFLNYDGLNNFNEKIFSALIKSLNDVKSSNDFLGGNLSAIPVLVLLAKIHKDEVKLQSIKENIKRIVYFIKEDFLFLKKSENITVGFAHGISGMVYGLLSAFTLLKDFNLIKLALELIQLENSFYDKDINGWLDRRSKKGVQSNFSLSWCNGVTGITLSRLKSLQLNYHIEIKEDLYNGLHSILDTMNIDCVDHLCCGRAGKLDLLIESYLYFRQDKYLKKALELSKFMIYSANNSSGYHLYPDLPKNIINMGLFQGLSGIGYQYLRVINPYKFKSILYLNDMVNVDAPNTD